MKVTKVVVHTAVVGTVAYVAHRYFSIQFNLAPFRIESNIGWFLFILYWLESLIKKLLIKKCIGM